MFAFPSVRSEGDLGTASGDGGIRRFEPKPTKENLLSDYSGRYLQLVVCLMTAYTTCSMKLSEIGVARLRQLLPVLVFRP